MKAYKSPLILNDFLLLNHNYHFIQPNNKKINISDLINEYQLEIDFSFQNVNNNTTQLFTKVSVNDIENPLPGYVLFIEGVCVFSFDESVELSERDKSSLLHISGLNICINNLRNILSTITSHGPFGKYILPSINLNRLLEDKHNKSQSDSGK